MADLAMKSALKSPLVTSANSSDKTQLPVYKVPYSSGVSLPLIQRISSETTATLATALPGLKFVTKCNPSGFWKMAYVRMNYRFSAILTGSTTLWGPVGLTMCDHEVKTFSTTLRTQTAELTQSALNTLSADVKASIIDRAFIHNAAGDVVLTPLVNTDYHSYCPIFFASFENPRNNWDLSTLEPITVVSTFRTVAKMGLVNTTTTLNAIGTLPPIELFQFVADRPIEDSLKIYDVNFTNQEYAFLGYDAETQITPYTGTAATAASGVAPAMKLPTTVPAFATHMYARLASAAAGGFATQNIRLTRVDINLNNSPFYYDIPTDMSSAMTDMMGGSAGLTLVEPASATVGSVAAREVSKISTINWNEKLDRTGYSGSLAFGSINNPEFIFYFAIVDASVYELVIVTEFYTSLILNGQSGRVYKSISS